MRDGSAVEGPQIDAVVGTVRDLFGADLVGVYPHGSTATGRLRPGSDLDVMAVLRRPTTSVERRLLLERLLVVSGVGTRPIELTLVVGSDVRPWRYPPTCEFLYGEWLRRDFETGMVPDPAPSPDLAVLISMVLASGRRLHGPPPAEVLDPVPDGDVRRSCVDAIPGLLANLATDTANVLLTLARCWSTVATGRIRAKDEAADWALERLDGELADAVARARAVYLDGSDGDWDGLRPCLPEHAHALAERVVTALDRGRPA